MSTVAPELGEEYLAAIAEAITNAPRSLQTKIGPSELGHPCARRLGYKLLGTPERVSKPNWKATVGTACHSWLEAVFDGWNVLHGPEREGRERFLIETRVSVGEVNGVEITGSCDLFDLDTGVVTDWKTTGPTALLDYKRKGPGEQYRAQAHLYGRGWQRAGHRVTRVQLVFLPRNGELDETYVWSEEYNEAIAVEALTRVSGIAIATTVLGRDALAQLPTANKWCHLCPYFLAGSTDPAVGCPGDPESPANNPRDPGDPNDPFAIAPKRGRRK